MKPEETREIEKFIENNRPALALLAQKVKTVDTVRGAKTLDEVLGRQKAIQIIDEWLTELWSVKTEDLPEPLKEDNLYKVID